MYAALRIAHIIFGVYWGGMYIFTTLMLLPKLHGLGAKIERSVLRSVLSIASPVSAVSALIVIGTGVAMTFQSPWREVTISTLLTSGWGISIFIGFVAAVVATLIGFILLMPMGLRMDKIYRAIGNGEPNAGQDAELDGILNRLRKIDRVNFVLVTIALISMPVARFV